MKKQIILKRSTIAVATVFLLSACAAGGGGTGGSAPPMPTTPDPNNPSNSTVPPGGGGVGGGVGGGGGISNSSNSVPFGTPTLAGNQFSPYNGSSPNAVVSQTYSVNNLTGDNGTDLIVAGRMSQPATASSWVNNAIQIFDWQNGQLVNDTAKWFPGGSNIIVGTDPTIQFADFFHTGRTSMFVSPSTDGVLGNSGPATLFTNNGSSFSRTDYNIGSVWGHGAAIGSLNNNGWDDVAVSDYGSKTTLFVNNHTNGFTPYQAVNDSTGVQALQFGGSSIVIGNFKNDNSSYLVLTDNTCQDTGTGCNNNTKIHMYSWNLTSSSGSVGSASTLDPNTTQTSGLPSSATKASNTPLLTYGFVANLPNSTYDHGYLALASNFNGSSGSNLIVFSTPNSGGKNSAIQFFQNNGSGVFSDVTGSMLSGYNTNTYPSYHPQFVDLGNGYMSMIVSAQDYSGNNNSTQILVKSSAGGPYVAAFQNIITSFSAQANQIAGVTNQANLVNLVKDPSGNLYLVSTLQSGIGTNTKQSIYVSPLQTGVSAATAQGALNQMKSVWPYMSPATANQILANTGQTFMTDAGQATLINSDAIVKPIGSLNINTQVGSFSPRGFIGGVKLENGDAVAMDNYGRAFPINLSQNNYFGPNSFGMNSEHIDQFNLTSHSEYLINGSVNTVETPAGPLRLGMEDRNRFNTISGDPSMGATIGSMPKQYSIGLPEIYRKGNFTTGLQYTNLTSSPWFNFTGAWGSVNNSGTLEHHVTYRYNGFSVQGALTYTSTTFTPGLVTRITPITGTWAESGYRYSDYGSLGDMGIYIGVKPIVLNGGLTANMPTSVDNNGNTVYTQTKMGVVSNVTPYARALYTNNIDRNTQYRVSGMTTTTGLWRAMAELRYTFD